MSPTKPVSGHGISAAVRNSIKEWMTDRVIDIMLKTAKPIGMDSSNMSVDAPARFRRDLRSADQWSRIARKRDLKTGVWKRTYYSKLFGITGPGLTVLTNKASKDKPDDMFIEYVTITYGKSVIGGGKVSVPSARLSQSGRKAAIKDFEEQSIFAEFTEKELAILTAELEHGADDAGLLLEMERFA